MQIYGLLFTLLLETELIWVPQLGQKAVPGFISFPQFLQNIQTPLYSIKYYNTKKESTKYFLSLS